MSYAAMAAVRGSGLTDATVVDVLEALAFCLNGESGKCCPSTLRIAQLARRSPNVVRQTLKKLEADGLISSTQLPGQERYFKLFLERLPKAKPLSKVKGVAEVKPLSEVTGDPFQKCEGTPVRSERGPLSEVKPEQVSEQGREQGNEQVVGAFDENAPPPNDSDLEAMASSGSLFAEADVPAEEPPKKKPRPPTVPFPDSLPDEWRERALKLRPNIDPEEVFTALRSRYGETTVRKAMSTWKREYFNWHGRQWPKKTFNRNQTQGRAYVPGDRKFSYATLDTSQFDYEG